MNNEVFILTVTDSIWDINGIDAKTIAVCDSFDKAMDILKIDKENRVWFTPTYENKVNLENTWINTYWLSGEFHDGDNIAYVTYTIARWEVM